MKLKILFIVFFIININAFANNKTKNISLQLQWKHAFQFAGYYIAKEKGYYEDIGLDVDIKEFKYGLDITHSVEMGVSTYGVGRPTIIIDKANGKNIILLSAIYQSSPLIVLATKQSGIRTIEDFKNKKIMTVNDSSNDTVINAMLKSQKLNLKNMDIIEHSFNIKDLINRKADLMTAYISDQPYQLKQLGYEPIIFHPKDYGFDFYSDILFTSTHELKNNPQRVKNFTRMSLKGWEYAFNHIEETVELILKKYNTQNLSKDALIYEAKELKKLAYYNTKHLGEMKKNKLIKLIGMYNLINDIKSDINLKDLIYMQDYKTTLLTSAEKAYLKKKKRITLCIDPKWMPFEQFDEEGKYTGMSSEYFKIFQKEISIPIDLIRTRSWAQTMKFAKNRKCDILSLAMPTHERNKYMNFTLPYISTPLVLATKPNVQFIDQLESLANKRVGITKGYAFNEIIRKDYPNIHIVDVKNMEEGLQKVVNGELFGFIDALATIGYLFQTKFTGELKISGKFDNKWELGIAVRKDDLILLNIFNKMIQNLPKNLKQTILNKYIGIHYKQGFDYTLLWKVIILFSILALFLYYRYYTTNNYNKKIDNYLKMINSHVLVSTSDINGTITDASDALCELTGYSKDELIGKNHNIFRHKDMPHEAFKDLWETIQDGNSWRGEVKNRNKDGSFYWAEVIISPLYNRQMRIEGFSAIRHDITDKKALEKLSITDTLTKIPNRLYLDNNYEKEVKRVDRYGGDLSIILIDIDFFKSINDTHGHDIGDKILIEVSHLLQKNIRKIDILGRWGGEEFLIICPQTPLENAQKLANNLRKLLENNQFHLIDNITCSFGVTKYLPSDEKNETFKRADKALYEAKTTGRNKVIVY